MRLFVILFLSLRLSPTFACSEMLKNHQAECQAQERFLKMQDEFKKLSIDMNNLKGFKIPRAFGAQEMSFNKDSLNNHTPETLKGSREWIIFQAGQSFIDKLKAIYLDQSDILKLHKTMFGPKNLLGHIGSDAGKLRINQGITNPTENISCEDQMLTTEMVDFFDDMDLRTGEGYPLLNLDELSPCKQSNLYSGKLVYYKGASMKQELGRWTNDFNDMIMRYEKSSDTADLSPLDYIADMRRWFIAIAPFSYGNIEVANALSDYFLKRLGLVPLPLKDLSVPQLLRPESNREKLKMRNREVLNFFESCLYENKVKPVSSNCSIF